MSSDILGMFNFLSDAGNPDAKLMFAAFIVFIVVAYKALKVLKNTVIVSVIAACFPFVLSRVFGFEVEITLELVLFYVVFGVVIYLLYEVFKMFYGTSKFLAGIISIVLYPFVLFVGLLKLLLGSGKEKKKRNEKTKDKKEKD